MKFNIAILIALLVGLAACTSVALATDPLKYDKTFLDRDPDGDKVPTWEEFLVGTDPYNSDSDNDGLPDYWELEYSQWRNPDPNALLDPTDSSDAHADYDYDPSSNGTGFNQGEREAEFKAVQSLKHGQAVTWPSDSEVTFTMPMFEEAGPHYDNYEEYYRPYTYTDPDTSQDSIRYMHTNPTKPDTDGDLILDPDDYEPLGWKNDGLSPGGSDVVEHSDGTKLKENTIVEDNTEIPYIAPVVPTNYEIFEIDLEQINNNKKSQPTNKDEHLIDIDNDGI
jgi:hypothetical protein